MEGPRPVEPPTLGEALIAAEVILIGADVLLGGPSGEGIVPAAGVRVLREGLEEAAQETGERAASGSLREGLMRTTDMTPPSQVRTPTQRPEAPRIENPELRTARNETQDNRMVDRQNAAAEEAARRPSERNSFWNNVRREAEDWFN